jgi:hypothetical protein
VLSASKIEIKVPFDALSKLSAIFFGVLKLSFTELVGLAREVL